MERTADVYRDTPDRPALPAWWIVALAWAVPATIAMLQALAPVMVAGTRGLGVLIGIGAATQFTRYMLWAPLTPLIFAAVRRFPFQRPGLARSIASCLHRLCIVFVDGLSAQLRLLALEMMSIQLGAPRAQRYVLTDLTAVRGSLRPSALTMEDVHGVADLAGKVLKN